VDAADRRRGRLAHYYLVHPDPWLIALADLMWQGIVQGLAWDAMKAVVRQGVDVLRLARIARSTAAVGSREKRARTTLGFDVTKYASDGRKQYHFFLGLRRKYDSASLSERHAIGTSFAVSKPRPEKRKRISPRRRRS